uniref:Ig-like domain-containing protein n=1 Tax=Membranihabitans maritimus TaxID=2904244 RepID=UPI001F17EAEC
DPENGTAAVDGLTGCIEYTPNMGYTGTDTTCIIVCDDLGNCDTTIVPVIVYPPQDTLDDVTVPQDSTVVICADSTGLPGTVSSVESCDPENGTAAVDGLTGCIEYTPDMGYIGTDTTCIIVCDDLGNCDTTVVPIIVYPPQDTVEDVTVPQDSTVVICADTTGLPGSVASVESCDPDNGSAVVDGLTGCIEYTPDMGYIGTDTTCIIVCDDLGNCDTTIIPILIESVALVANDDMESTSVNKPVEVAVLDNDTGPIDSTSVVILDLPSNGVASVNPDGTIMYTPNLGFVGNDTLTYVIDNIAGNASDTALVIIEVVEEIDPGPFSCRSFISPAVLDGGMLQVTVGDIATSNGENVYTVQVFNEWGAEIWSGENLSDFDYILENVDVCDYLGSTLTVRITNRYGSCESNLILDDTVSPILTSAFGTTIHEASDLDIPTARIDTGLLVTYCGYVPVPEDHEPTVINPCSTMNTRSSSTSYSVRAQPDWVEVIHCNEASDTSEIIYRTWEVFNKVGDLFTLTDTIVVLRLPMLTAESFLGYKEDTVYCEIEPLKEEGESVKRYAAWKQPLGIHDYEEAYSKLGGVVYELPLTIVGAGLLNAQSQGDEVLEEYLECVIVKKLDGTEITIGDIVSGDYMDDMLSTASSTQLSYGFLHAIYELGEDPVSLVGGAFTFFPYLLLEQGDWVLSENGFYEQVTEDWFYSGNANTPYWFAGGWPSIYGSGDCVRYCDVAEGELEDCLVQMIVPALEEGAEENDGCMLVCLSELTEDPHCGISIEMKTEDWTGSCPTTKGREITVTQTCWGETENDCEAEDFGEFDSENYIVDLEASDFESDKKKVAVLSQWLTLIDTIGPIFDFCYPEQSIANALNELGGYEACDDQYCGPYEWDHEEIVESIRNGEQYESARSWEYCNPTVYTTGSHDCAADVYVPSVTLKDECSGVHHVKAMVNGRAVWLERVSEANGFVTFAHTEDPIRIPFQGHGNLTEVRYEASDSCWNVSEWYKFIEIKDATPPTVVV